MLSCDFLAGFYAGRYGMTLDELQRKDRHRDTIMVKREVIRLLRGDGYTLVAIGRCLGYRDHSTVMHHLRKEKDGLPAGAQRGIAELCGG